MIVTLYRVGRNLNRAYRTCEAFGVTRMECVDCTGDVHGNLFAAAGHVDVAQLDTWPNLESGLALETFHALPIWKVDWQRVERIVIGGETAGLPRKLQVGQTAVIPMFGRVSGLTVEAALAIALHEWKRCG